MGLKLRVCRIDEVPIGEVRGFEVDGLDLPVMVTRVDDEFFASTSMCPHEDVSLLDGDNIGAVVICPGHAYEFDMRDGSCGHDAKLRLHTYKVSVIGDELFVSLF